MSFSLGVEPPASFGGSTMWFLFKDNLLLLRVRSEKVAIPTGTVPPETPMSEPLYLGSLDGTHCFAAELSHMIEPGTGFDLRGLRGLYGILPDDHMAIVGRAVQLVEWERTHRFCGKCGGQTGPLAGERAKRCEHCGLTVYPRITPAIITAVIDGDRILLAHNHKFHESLYSLLAGFVEAGESLEDCLRREVYEEVGVEVGDIRYFGSQPWPFPNSLMIGFFAKYAGGEIAPDGDEITHAAWFTPDAFPTLPMTGSISRKIIAEYERHYKAGTLDELFR